MNDHDHMQANTNSLLINTYTHELACAHGQANKWTGVVCTYVRGMPLHACPCSPIDMHEFGVCGMHDFFNPARHELHWVRCAWHAWLLDRCSRGNVHWVRHAWLLESSRCSKGTLESPKEMCTEFGVRGMHDCLSPVGLHELLQRKCALSSVCVACSAWHLQRKCALSSVCVSCFSSAGHELFQRKCALSSVCVACMIASVHLNMNWSEGNLNACSHVHCLKPKGNAQCKFPLQIYPTFWDEEVMLLPGFHFDSAMLNSNWSTLFTCYIVCI